MSIIIKSNCIDTKCRKEGRLRAQYRRQEDVVSGLTTGKGPQRGDFKLCREGDKIMKDYRSFKNPKDREKIKSEYFALRKEHQR